MPTEKEIEDFFNAIAQGEISEVSRLFKPELLNIQHGEEQETPVIIAVGNGHKEAVEFLLNNGADHTLKNKEGLDSIYIASLNNKIVICQSRVH